MLVQACNSADYDTTTGTCSAPVWIDYPTVLPPLSVTDGLALSSAIVGVWALAAGFRWVIRSMR